MFSSRPIKGRPHAGLHVRSERSLGITAGCTQDGTKYCPESQTQRDQSSVFFLKGEHCNLNMPNCSYAPPACTSTIFADVPCPSQYADWVNQLAAEHVTAGGGGGNFCPTDPLGSWQMLAWVQKIWNNYNPLPRASIVTYRDEGGRVVTEGVQSGSLDASAVEAYQRDNIYLGGQLVASGVWSGSGWTTLNYQFYAVDHLGSTRLVTDINSNSVQTLKYWPYGDDGPGTGLDAGQRLKFAGMERDSENKHYFDHARTQDFNLGRFVSADRVFGTPETPQSWNRYSYVMNSPVSLTDPWGFADSQVSCPPDPFGMIQGCSTSITVGGDAVPATPSNISNDWAHRLDWHLPTWQSFSRYMSRLGSQVDESFAGKPWVVGWVLPVGPIPGVAGLGPAGSIAWNPQTQNLCVGFGVGVSAGHSVSIGPLITSKGNVDAVLNGLSVSAGANATFPSPGVGYQVTANSSGVAQGVTAGVPGVSASVTWSACSNP